LNPGFSQKREAGASLCKKPGAGDEARTRDLNLGKVALYQLSYSRIANLLGLPGEHCCPSSLAL